MRTTYNRRTDRNWERVGASFRPTTVSGDSLDAAGGRRHKPRELFESRIGKDAEDERVGGKKALKDREKTVERHFPAGIKRRLKPGKRLPSCSLATAEMGQQLLGR